MGKACGRCDTCSRTELGFYHAKIRVSHLSRLCLTASLELCASRMVRMVVFDCAWCGPKRSSVKTTNQASRITFALAATRLIFYPTETRRCGVFHSRGGICILRCDVLRSLCGVWAAASVTHAVRYVFSFRETSLSLEKPPARPRVP